MQNIRLRHNTERKFLGNLPPMQRRTHRVLTKYFINTLHITTKDYRKQIPKSENKLVIKHSPCSEVESE